MTILLQAAAPDEEILEALREPEETVFCGDIQDLIQATLKRLHRLFPTPAVVDQARRLVVISEYLKLLVNFRNNPRIKRKADKAAEIACRNAGQSTHNFERKIKSQARYLAKHGSLPPYQCGNHTTHASLLDNESVNIKISEYLASLPSGEIMLRKFRAHLVQVIFPALDPILLKQARKNSISLRTACRWLRRLGYALHQAKKGVYIDGHERPDVRAAREEFLRNMLELQK